LHDDPAFTERAGQTRRAPGRISMRGPIFPFAATLIDAHGMVATAIGASRAPNGFAASAAAWVGATGALS
jgi:hypothetical protein